MADDLPFAENVFFLRRADVMDDHVFSARSLPVGKQTDMIAAIVEEPVDDIARLPIFILRQARFSCHEEDCHILHAPVVDVRIEFALGIKAHVPALVLDNELLQVEVDGAVRPDDDVRAHTYFSVDVAARIFDRSVGGVVCRTPGKLVAGGSDEPIGNRGLEEKGNRQHYCI